MKVPGECMRWVAATAIVMAAFNVAEAYTEECPAFSRPCRSLVNYITQSNQTVINVAKLFTVDSYSILAANNLDITTAADGLLDVGLNLRIPLACQCVNGTRQTQATVHTVQSGDSLSVIASFYGGLVNYTQIATANGVANPNLIFPGEQFVIPFPCGCAMAGEKKIFLAYVVQTGDSYNQIATQYGVNTTDLLLLNGLPPTATALSPGDGLEIPLPACASSFNKKVVDRGMIVAEGTYTLTADKCVQCSCGSNASMVSCTPTPDLLSSSCSGSLSCGSSGLTIGSVSTANSSGVCSVTACNYMGYTGSASIKIHTAIQTTNETTCPAPPSAPKYSPPISSPAPPPPSPPSTAPPPTGPPSTSPPPPAKPPSSGAMASAISRSPFTALAFLLVTLWLCHW